MSTAVNHEGISTIDTGWFAGSCAKRPRSPAELQTGQEGLRVLRREAYRAYAALTKGDA